MSESNFNISTKKMVNHYSCKDVIILESTIEYFEFDEKNNKKVWECFNKAYCRGALWLQAYGRKKLYPMAAKDYTQSDNENRPFHTYDLQNAIFAPYARAPFLSTYNDVYEYTGGAHGITTRYSDTYNTRTGRRLPLSKFFPESCCYKDIAIEEIKRQAQIRQKNEQMFFDEYLEDIPKYFECKNYYLRDNGLVIYYQLYTIAPYSSGIIEFFMPFSVFEC